VRENDSGGLERLVSLDTRGETTTASSSRNKIFVDEIPQEPLHDIPQMRTQSMTFTPTLQPAVSLPWAADSSLSALNVTAKSLELSLHTLSQRLIAYSTCHGQAAVDSGTIGLTADAIGRTTYALSQVKQLQRSYN